MARLALGLKREWIALALFGLVLVLLAGISSTREAWLRRTYGASGRPITKTDWNRVPEARPYMAPVLGLQRASHIRSVLGPPTESAKGYDTWRGESVGPFRARTWSIRIPDGTGSGEFYGPSGEGAVTSDSEPVLLLVGLAVFFVASVAAVLTRASTRPRKPSATM